MQVADQTAWNVFEDSTMPVEDQTIWNAMEDFNHAGG